MASVDGLTPATGLWMEKTQHRCVFFAVKLYVESVCYAYVLAVLVNSHLKVTSVDGLTL